MKRTDGLWIGVLGALILMSFGLLPERGSGEQTDSYSASFGGKRAIFDMSGMLFPRVERNTEHLIPPEDADTLVIAGPAQYPDRVEWQLLHDWVAEGHALVFASRWHDPIVELRPFGVKIETAWSAPPESKEEGERTPQPTSEGLDTDLAQGNLDWVSHAHIVTSSESARVEVSLDGLAQVTTHVVGEGLLVVVSSDYIFSNVSLARGDNGVLAFRILELAGPRGPVYFDEWLNTSGPPKVVGLLFERPLRHLTLEFLILVVLFAWRSSRRFGPPEAERLTLRRSLTEHASALGNLHYKVGSGGRIVASYLEYFRNELRLHYLKADEVAALAVRAGAPAESVSHLMTRASRAAKNPRLVSAEAARLVRSLAALKHKAERLKGASNGN